MQPPSLSHTLAALALAAMAASACAPPATTAAPAAPSPASSGAAPPGPTPFQPAELTPTPGVIDVWVSLAVPPSLLEALALVTEAGGRAVRFVDAPEAAGVRVEPDAEVPLSTWIYAVAAPFPTLQDEIGLQDLKVAWSGSAPAPVFADASSSVEAARTRLGDPGPMTVAGGEALADQAWAARPALALLPFEALSPRWKVLGLEGQSPLRRDFDPGRYPLAVTFGLSGDAEAVRLLADALDWPATNRDPERLTVVAVTGVTALTRATAWMLGRRGVTEAAAKISDWFQGADIVHVSNEVAFAEDCPPPDPSPGLQRFCSPPEDIGLLDAIGVDTVELTGNHVMDWGATALDYTLGLYRERGWSTFGGGANLEAAMQPALFEHHGNRIAFLGCNPAGPFYAWATADLPGAAPCDTDRLYAESAQLRQQGYLTVFTFQWQESYRSWPLPDQVAGFHEAVDAGAVIVSGSQAHQPMGFEFYNGGFIHYGPGNLFFDQMDSLDTRQEFVDRYIFYDGRHIGTELLTAVLEDWFQPRPMTEAERAEFLDAIFRASGW